jgi:hypothetical protein
METTIVLHASLDEITSRVITEVKKEFTELKTQFQPIQPTEYLTRNEVKELLKVDLSTIHNWTKKGKLKSYGIGNRIYYKRLEVEQTFIAIN